MLIVMPYCVYRMGDILMRHRLTYLHFTPVITTGNAIIYFDRWTLLLTPLAVTAFPYNEEFTFLVYMLFRPQFWQNDITL